jgi:hypothetical protein
MRARSVARSPSPVTVIRGKSDHRNFYKVEKWTKDGSKVVRMLYSGSNLDKAREVFAAAIYHRPRIQLTIRQRTHVLEQWPKAAT